MKNSKGYLIPTNAQPTEYRCLRVFVPDDDLYQRALLGSILFLGSWSAWERDTGKRGRLAADAWKSANDMTMENLSTMCATGDCEGEDMGELLDAIELLKEKIGELDMNISINNNNCCCGDEASSAGSGVEIDGGGVYIPPEWEGVPPPWDVDEVDDIGDVAMCRTANWLAVTVVSVVRGFANIGTTGMFLAAVVAAILQIVAVIDGVPATGAAWGIMLVTVATTVLTLNSLVDFSAGDFDTLATQIEGRMGDFVCSLKDWTTAGEVSTAVTDFLDARIDDTALIAGWQPLTVGYVKDVFTSLFGSAFGNFIAYNVGYLVPSDFVSVYTCDCGTSGDSCPSAHTVILGYGTLPTGNLSGRNEGFASVFNPSSGLFEVFVELAENYCLTVDDNGHVLSSANEVCSDGSMVASAGECARSLRYTSSAPFAITVHFGYPSSSCTCPSSTGLVVPDNMNADIWEANGRAAFSNYSGDFELVMLPESGVDAVAKMPFDSLPLAVGETVGWHYIDVDLDVKENYAPNTLEITWYYDDSTSHTEDVPFVSGYQEIRLFNPNPSKVMITGQSDMIHITATWAGGGSNADLLDACHILFIEAVGHVNDAP